MKRIKPGPGQESVFDYPRPPRVDPVKQPVQVYFNLMLISETTRALRVLETSHPPTIYIPKADVRMEYLELTEKRSSCEFKGRASYWTLRVDDRVSEHAAWSYPDPAQGYGSLRDHFSFYPSRVDACFLGGEQVTAQEGDFYGGWITSAVVGPFKGPPGTQGW